MKLGQHRQMQTPEPQQNKTTAQSEKLKIAEHRKSQPDTTEPEKRRPRH